MILFSKAASQYLEEQGRKSFTQMTLDRYKSRLKLFEDWAQDPEITSVLSETVSSFFKYLQEEYTFPRGKGKAGGHYSANMILQVKYTHKDFWHWAAMEYQFPNPFNVGRFDTVVAPINPFTPEELKQLLKEIRIGFDSNQRKQHIGIGLTPDQLREQVVCLILLDTGITGAQLCRLLVQDVDLKTGSILVRDAGEKWHFAGLSTIALAILRYYLEKRLHIIGEEGVAPLVCGDAFEALTPEDLLAILRRIGKRARVEDISLPRFRDTFATKYFESGGNVELLSKLLGVNLDTASRYVDRSEEAVLRAMKEKSIIDRLMGDKK